MRRLKFTEEIFVICCISFLTIVVGVIISWVGYNIESIPGVILGILVIVAWLIFIFRYDKKQHDERLKREENEKKLRQEERSK